MLGRTHPHLATLVAGLASGLAAVVLFRPPSPLVGIAVVLILATVIHLDYALGDRRHRSR